MDSFNIQNYFKRGKTVVLTLRHGDEDGARQWSDKDTNDLMNLMKQFLPDFQNQTKRKKDVWEDVSKQMQKSGLCWTPEDCRKKWSNMIRTFKSIEEQRLDPTSNFKRGKWPFYDSMKQLLTLDGSDALPEALAVVQLMNGNSPTFPPPRTAARKTTVFETAGGQRFSTSQRHLLHDSRHSLQSASVPSTQMVATSLHQLHTDILGVNLTDTNVQLPLPVDVQTSVSSDSETPLFSDISGHPAASVLVGTSLPSSVSAGPYHQKSASSIRAMKRSGKSHHGGKHLKRPCNEDAIDDVFVKFMETSQKQNDQLLEKMTSFHDNALTLMHERNEILREIRDAIHGSNVANESGLAHASLGNDDAEDTLTLHMGPAFSTNSTVVSNAAVESGGVSTQLNSSMVMSEQATASALSTFQLEDGTVLSAIDTTTDKGVLSNLESFAESVIPEVSSLLHPTLVSVIPVPSSETNSIELPLASSASSLKKHCEQ